MDRGSTSGTATFAKISTVLAGLALLSAALAVPVAAVTVPTDPEPDLACPAEYGTGLLTDYRTTVETRADSADWFVSVEFTIANVDDTEASCQVSLSTYELPTAEFSLPQAVSSHDAGTFGPGTHVLTAELPRQGNVATCFSQYDFAFGPVIDQLTNENRYGDRQIRAQIVGSETCDLDGEQPGGTATVMVVKHNCPDVATMAEFEAVEARAATNPTTPEAAFGMTVETVLECPTVVLPGDAQTPGAVAGGESTFDFSVSDADGTAVLSSDGMFAASAACETDVMYDADRSGVLDANVCLDLSHYAFEVSTAGQVTVTETAAPAGLAFGALRFTPGSGDEAALVSAANGEIVLDMAADEDGMIMLHVYNFAAAGEQPGGTATVMVMKHNCPDVATMAEFEAVEARAATNPTTPEAAFGMTVETVLECPTVVLPGDAQTPGAVAGGESTFDFSVSDADGTAVLSSDGMFAASAACETDVMYDADRSGVLDANVCLDLSHYAFEVSTAGQVTVTETAVPAGLAFGALRFTPGSGDEAALVSAANGEIVLDMAADEDGMIMLHVYNFAAAGEQPGEGVQGGQGGPGTLPNTAMPAPTSWSSSLALLAVSAVSLGAVRLATARRRR